MPQQQQQQQPPQKIKISREGKDILTPLKEAMAEYQNALPRYMEAMNLKYPPQAPIDLECNERRMRESLKVLAEKLAAECDENAIWRKNRDQEVAVKTEIIAKKEEIPNAYRALLREMEASNERLRTTQRNIHTNRKQMDEMREEMDTMSAWIRSGEPASKGMLRSVGLLKKSNSQACQVVTVHKTSGTPFPTKSASSWRGANSQNSAATAASKVQVPSPASSWRSRASTASSASSEAPPPAPPPPPLGVDVKPKVTFKTRRPPRLAWMTATTTNTPPSSRRAEYCPIGNKVSFRKKVTISTGSANSQGRDSSTRVTTPEPVVGRKPNVTVVPPPKGAAEGARRKTNVTETVAKKPPFCVRAQKSTSVPPPVCRKKTTPMVVRPNTATATTRRPVSPAATAATAKKKPPWRPMA